MKSKLLLLAAGVVALSTAMPAFGAACSTFSTLDTLLTAGGCTIGSVSFSGFSYSNSIAASSVTLNSAGTGTAGNFAGLAFATTGGFSTPFSLTYTVSCVSCTFIGSQVNANIQPVFGGGGMTLTYTDSGGALTATAAAQDMSHAIGGTSDSVSNVLNAGGAGDRLQTLQNNYYIQNTSATPEPTSLILFGTGFLAVGLAARARRKARS